MKETGSSKWTAQWKTAAARGSCRMMVDGMLAPMRSIMAPLPELEKVIAPSKLRASHAFVVETAMAHLSTNIVVHATFGALV